MLASSLQAETFCSVSAAAGLMCRLLATAGFRTATPPLLLGLPGIGMWRRDELEDDGDGTAHRGRCGWFLGT